MNVIAALAERVAALAADDDTAEATRTLVRDTLAVGLAGRIAPHAAAVAQAAEGWGPGAAAQAFVHGFRIHALEWDAVHEGAVVHALSAVTAAVRAAARRDGARDLAPMLEAIHAGVEVACLLGVAATGPLRFFRPATAGAVGAAAAVARLLGLPPERIAHALALGVGFAGGTMQAHLEGSVALPLQVAAAARAGLAAADLAARGLTGPAGALDGPFGYFPLFDEGAPDRHVEGFGRRILEVSVKPWPSGRASHGVLEALARVRARHPAAAIARVEAHVPPLVVRLVGRPWRPDMTPAWARLCLPFLVALMLADGQIDPRRFHAAAFTDPALKALGERVRLVNDGNPDPNALRPQRIVVHFRDAPPEEVILPGVLGSPEAPLSAEQRRAKWAFALELAGLPPDLDPLADLQRDLAP
ncbi:MAG: MmgE/PrpD family protein [Sphingomonadaceae bacterium]|uniref:MmgE/PrpD family protein n=1 Tax=Thermaurantiacus sp. TaxID=2820283 RepID=UPI00298EE2A7|nr:MmgE/PrpD family protein [Thermaurantiacus sp.]MCS6987193.1 MmgE/PrpD family protein [Sphingomonadaceae bacterium]MDW8415773.1 MmgE/PrpD family protein [Thermaurantiacus sp.]